MKIKEFGCLRKSEIKKVEKFVQNRDGKDSRVTGYSYNKDVDECGFIRVKCEICSNDMAEREMDAMIHICLWDRRRSFVDELYGIYKMFED